MIQGVQIFSPELAKQQQGRGKTGAPLFVKDQIVEATIVKVISPTRSEIMVAGKKLTAETSFELTQGETLRLKVTRSGGFEILKSLESMNLAPQIKGPVLAALGSLTGDSPFASLAKLVMPLFTSSSSNPMVGQTSSSDSTAGQTLLTSKGSLTPDKLSHLRDLLFSITLNSDVADEKYVPRLLEKSGILWEKSLATLVLGESSQSGLPPDFHKAEQNDLKGYLLSLLSGAKPEEKEQLLPLREFVDAMEKFQVLNSHSSDSSKYLIPFPIFSNNSFSFGQLFFDLGGQKNETRQDAPRLVRISVFLTMTNLGDLRVDLSVLNKEITAMFQVEDESVVSFIKTMIPAFRQRLRAQGFKVLQAECRRGTPALISNASLADQVLEKGAWNLNLVV